MGEKVKGKMKLYIKLMLLAVILLVTWMIGTLYERYQKGETWCDENNITHCGSCGIACWKVNATYLKYDNTGLGSNECWCKKEGNPIQVF